METRFTMESDLQNSTNCVSAARSLSFTR